jgi:hypothetical protein
MTGMARFKEQFGLDYLKRDSSSKSDFEIPGTKSTEDALLAYARPLLDALESAPRHEAKLFDIAQQIGVRVDTLYPVVDYLSKRGYIVVAHSDKLGNDLLRLTPDGTKLLTQ